MSHAALESDMSVPLGRRLEKEHRGGVDVRTVHFYQRPPQWRYSVWQVPYGVQRFPR